VERARRREFAELVADHVFRDEHRNVLLAVVNAEGEATNCGRIVERRDQVLITSLRPEPRRDLCFLEQIAVDKGTFPNERVISLSLLVLPVARTHDVLRGTLVSCASWHPWSACPTA